MLSHLIIAVNVLLATQVNAFTTVQPRHPYGLLPLSATIEPLTESEEALLFGNDDDYNDERTSLNSNRRQPPAYNPLDRAKDPLINTLAGIRSSVTSCPALWLQLSKACPDRRALYDAHHCDAVFDQTFQEFAVSVQKSAGVFHSIGITKGDTVAILGENSAHWLLADQGLQLAGAASAVRGADAPLDELRYIYDHCNANQVAVVQGPKLVEKLLSDSNNGSSSSPLGLVNANGPVRTVLLLNREKRTDADLAELEQRTGVRLWVLADAVAAAKPLQQPPSLGPENLATIVYTSGTTGQPKGVMLTHGNLLHQTGHRLAPTMPYETSEPLPGEKMVSLLPVWHITERTFELWMAARGCSVVYSSIRTFKKDLAQHQPEWLVLVPRVLEKIAAGVQDKFASSAATKTVAGVFTKVGHAKAVHSKRCRGLVTDDEKSTSVLSKLKSRALLTVLSPLNAVGNKLVWSKVKDGFGGNLKTIISGGSALSGALEEFYETAGLTVLVGYGLTECSPLLSFRRSDRNLVYPGCAGAPASETAIKIVDPTNKRRELPFGEAGLILGKGPQVMKGYYRNAEATKKVLDNGWFDTGDLGRINPETGDLILTGRAKDTIVLSNGENIEPVPIEDSILGSSPLIDQVMLTGQDGKSLLAITVLNPSELGKQGFLDPSQAVELQTAAEKLNDPKCTAEACDMHSKYLREAGAAIRANKSLQTAMTKLFRSSTSSFRKWEKVSNSYLTLEPFAMINGQLTQSYKVKRAQVLERYQDEL